jgi:GH18 family chitinase
MSYYIFFCLTKIFYAFIGLETEQERINVYVDNTNSCVVDHAAGRIDMPRRQQCCTRVEVQMQLSQVENQVARLSEGE